VINWQYAWQYRGAKERYMLRNRYRKKKGNELWLIWVRRLHAYSYATLQILRYIHSKTTVMEYFSQDLLKTIANLLPLYAIFNAVKRTKINCREIIRSKPKKVYKNKHTKWPVKERYNKTVYNGLTATIMYIQTSNLFWGERPTKT